jgi:serine/threonine protein kinase
MLTRTGVIVGTPGYMAPEQARGERGIDPRADVFALGCVLYRCLTGADAFGADDVLASMLKIVLEEPPHVRELRADVPPEVDHLVRRLLEKSPGGRPRDGTAVADEIRALAGKRQPLASPAPPKESGLTTSEWRLMCVLLARSSRAASAASDAAPLERLRAAVAPHGGRLELLADGSCLVSLVGAGAAADQAAQAARCGLAMSSSLR